MSLPVEWARTAFVVSLYSMLWIFAAFFGLVGLMRGLRRELVAGAGIILISFALFQFDNILRGILLASVPNNLAFLIQLALFSAVIYVAYRNPSLVASQDENDGPRRTRLQNALLGGVVGAVNGFLIWSAIWYFLDINEYPFDALIAAPAPNSFSALNIGIIPLAWLGGAALSSEFLVILVIVVFVIVLFVI